MGKKSIGGEHEEEDLRKGRGKGMAAWKGRHRKRLAAVYVCMRVCTDMSISSVLTCGGCPSGVCIGYEVVLGRGEGLTLTLFSL